MKDLLLDEENSLTVINGDFVVSESEIQEVALILQTTQGEWKETPVLGAGLYQFINAKATKLDIEGRVKLHLSLDNKDYSDLKGKIKTDIKTN